METMERKILGGLGVKVEISFGPMFAMVVKGGGLSRVLKPPVTGGISGSGKLLALGQNEGVNVVTSKRSGCRHGKNTFT